MDPGKRYLEPILLHNVIPTESLAVPFRRYILGNIMTSISSFHENVAFLQSLAMGKGSGDPHTGTHSTAARNYSIRRCIRNLQQLLVSDDLKMMLIDGQSATDLSLGGGYFPCIATPDENPVKTHHPTYDQVTQDLIALLTMEFDGIGDPSIERTFYESILCPVMDLLDEAPHLGTTQVRCLFHHVLNLLHVQVNISCTKDEDGLDSGSHLLQLLDLMNRHVTNHEQLHGVFNDDHEVFVALHTLLHYSEKKAARIQNPEPPCMELAIFINSIIEYWVFQCLAIDHDQSHAECESDVDPVNDVNVWVQMQFMQQQQYYSSPELLQQDVSAYISRVECYGTTLIESTLHMLEDSIPASSIRDTGQAHSSSQQGENDNGACQPIHSKGNHLTEDEDHDVKVLKYATLATSFLVAIQKTNLSLANPVANATLALSRSLWREYVNFVVRRISTAAGPTNLTMNGDDTFSAASNTVDIANGGSDGLDLCMVATDTLWRLAQYHYPTHSTNRCRRNSNKYDDIPMILVTILCLWKYTTTFWNDDTIDWMKRLLQEDFPNTTSSGKELRKGLYGAILSSAYFPSHDTIHAYGKGPIDMMTTLLLHDFEEPGKKALSESSDTDPQVDPWKAWVSSQISNGVS